MATPPSSADARGAAPAHIEGKQSLGMAAFTLAMCLVPLMDAGAKILSATLSPFFIAFLRYLVQIVILVVVLKALRRAILPGIGPHIVPLALAGLFLASAISTLFFALRYLPLANTVALFFVEPLILTALSALILRETVGWHRTTAVIVGLIGALIVIRPNLVHYGWATLLPLVSATAFASTMIVYRKITNRLDSLRIQTISGLFAALFLGGATLVTHASGLPGLAVTAPSANEWMLLLALGVIATFAQTLITVAVKFAEASVIAPFQYVEIIGATILGYLIFDEFPDALTWTGTAIILAAGLYIIHRERKLARARLAIRAPN